MSDDDFNFELIDVEEVPKRGGRFSKHAPLMERIIAECQKRPGKALVVTDEAMTVPLFSIYRNARNHGRLPGLIMIKRKEKLFFHWDPKAVVPKSVVPKEKKPLKTGLIKRTRE